MTERDKEEIIEVIDEEGFDYTFLEYSDFEEIEDEEFHKLRKNYIRAANKLRDFFNLEY